MQNSLFEQKPAIPLSRRSDPATSRIAGREVEASGLASSQRAKVLAALRECARPVTSAELAADFLMERHLVARRLPDCAKLGLVKKVGVKVCAVTGKKATTWRAS